MHTHTEHKQYISSSDRTCTVHVPSEKIVLRAYEILHYHNCSQKNMY